MTARANDGAVGKATMRLCENMDIGSASACRKELLECVDRDDDLVIDMTGVETIDFCGLQLLLSLVRECDSRAVAIRFEGALRPLVQSRLNQSGFVADSCPDGESLLAQLRALGPLSHSGNEGATP